MAQTIIQVKLVVVNDQQTARFDGCNWETRTAGRSNWEVVPESGIPLATKKEVAEYLLSHTKELNRIAEVISVETGKL